MKKNHLSIREQILVRNTCIFWTIRTRVLMGMTKNSLPKIVHGKNPTQNITRRLVCDLVVFVFHLIRKIKFIDFFFTDVHYLLKLLVILTSTVINGAGFGQNGVEE